MSKVEIGRRPEVGHPAAFKVEQPHERPLLGLGNSPVVADRVSRALRQEADVRRNHEFFNGRNVARTPLSTAGHNQP